MRSLAFSALLALAAASAHAQNYSFSSGSIGYSYSVSSGNAGDLNLDRDELFVYNLVVPFNPAMGADNSAYYAPYEASTGNGTASAEVNPATTFDSSTGTGFNAIDSSASATVPGTASSSVGSQYNSFFTNNGTDDITIDINATAFALGGVGIDGTHSTSNFAQVDTYVGFYNVNLTTGTPFNPFVHVFGDDTGLSATFDGWTSLGGNLYSLSTSVTILPGESHLLAYYTSSKNVVSAPVPEPASMAALGLGALAMLRRRKRA